MRTRSSVTLLSFSHACVDVYQGAVAALVPFFVAERSYSYAAVSGIVLAASLLSSVAQPVFGALTDRRATPWLLVLRGLGGHAAVEGRADDERGVDDWASFARLASAVVCRSVVFVGLATFVALYAQERTGGGTPAGAAALSLLYLGGAVGTALGGSLASRWDRVRVVRVSYLVTVGAVAGVVLAPGWGLYPFLALTSAGLYVPFSLQVTLAQDYLPTRIGTASGITLGLTVGVGGLASPMLGALAEATSLRSALVSLIAMPAVSWLFFRTLTEPTADSPARRSPADCTDPHNLP